VCLPLLIFPCTIKSRSFLLAPADPGGRGKMAVCLYASFLLNCHECDKVYTVMYNIICITAGQ